MRANIEDNDQLMILRFIYGLNMQIANCWNLFLDEAYAKAIKIEEQLKDRKSRSHPTYWSKSKETWKSSTNWDKAREAKQVPKASVDKGKAC